jgi:predicted RNA-binding Zn-ribbon protein involved in translation (DUF1610 family)
MKKTQEQKTETKLAEPLNTSIKKESVDTVTAEDKIELERREAYIETKTRNLLRQLLQDGDKGEIIPIYTPGLGYMYKITYNGSSDTDQFSKDCLEDLSRLDILYKSFFDSINVCPNCESTVMTLHDRCPKCKSHNVEKTSLTEHISCGYIDQKDKYIDNKCPKCGELLIEGQYRNMGRWYVCQECNEKFENPEFDLVCRNCNKNFSIKQAQVTVIPKFSLNLNRKKEIRQNVASLESIRAILADLDFKVEIPGFAIGQKSGMQHHFSLLAKKEINGQEVIVALDHAVSESEVQASPLILYIYKTSELKVDIPIFIAMPELSETAKKIAQGHDILLIEGSTEGKEEIEKIKLAIQNRIEQMDQKAIANNDPVDDPPENKAETKSFFGKLMGKKR